MLACQRKLLVVCTQEETRILWGLFLAFLHKLYTCRCGMLQEQAKTRRWNLFLWQARTLAVLH